MPKNLCVRACECMCVCLQIFDVPFAQFYHGVFRHRLLLDGVICECIRGPMAGLCQCSMYANVILYGYY